MLLPISFAKGIDGSWRFSHDLACVSPYRQITLNKILHQLAKQRGARDMNFYYSFDSLDYYTSNCSWTYPNGTQIYWNDTDTTW